MSVLNKRNIFWYQSLPKPLNFHESKVFQTLINIRELYKVKYVDWKEKTGGFFTFQPATF